MNPAQDKIAPMPNAVMLKKRRNVTLPTTFKEQIRQKGFYWDSLKGFYVGPYTERGFIADLLEEYRLKVELIDITWPLKQSKIASKECQIEILDQKIHRLQNEIMVMAHPMGMTEFDFVLPPENEKDGRYPIFMDLHKKVTRLRELQQEVQQHRDNLKAIEAEDNELERLLQTLEDNEYGDAELFCSRFGDRYLYDPIAGDFFWYNGTHWEKDTSKRMVADIKRIGDLYTAHSKNKSYDAELQETLRAHGHVLKSSRKAGAIKTFLTPLLAKKVAWDEVPYKLPCKNGMLDLVTGQLLPLNSKDYIRATTPFEYDSSATCPKFEKFIDDITCGDTELAGFMQRLFGYIAMGSSKEEKIFYFYGAGRNGKGTLMHVIQKVFGGMAKTLPSEMLLQQTQSQASEAASPALATLHGCRLAVFSEINEKRRLDAAKVKNLSGGDIIVCRQLFSNEQLQIKPTHTMILQTNYKPHASSEDMALWERIVLVPFNACFADNPNINLKAELLHEAQGVLNWVLKGAQDYELNGLQIPDSVMQQTASYRKECDQVQDFLDECCDIVPEFSTTASKLYEAFKQHCGLRQSRALSNREFFSQLESKGYYRKRTKHNNVVLGVHLLDI